jgi:flagellar biosynthesis/type III secretory pathway protein FliH
LSKTFLPDLFRKEAADLPACRMLWPELAPKRTLSPLFREVRAQESAILKAANEKALVLEQQAYEKGFAQGEKDGLELGEKRLEAVVQNAQRLIAEIESHREGLYEAFEKEMVQLVLAISKKILVHPPALKEETILSTVHAAFKHVLDQRNVTIRLHPSDYGILTAHPDRLPWPSGESGRVKMVKDPSISRGGCYLETAFGDVDGTIEGQFEQIVAFVWKAFEQEELCAEPLKAGGVGIASSSNL